MIIVRFKAKEIYKLSEMFLNNIPLFSSDLIGSYWIISDESDISFWKWNYINPLSFIFS